MKYINNHWLNVHFETQLSLNVQSNCLSLVELSSFQLVKKWVREQFSAKSIKFHQSINIFVFGDQPRLLKWNPDWIDQTDIFWCQISWGKFSRNECYWKMLLLHDPIILCCHGVTPVGCCRYGKISQNCKPYWRSFVNAIV